MEAENQGKAHPIHWLPSKGEPASALPAAFCLLPAGSASACMRWSHTLNWSTMPHCIAAFLLLQPLPSAHTCCAEEAGVDSRGRLALEVASVFPVMMGAAFTQNNINSAVSAHCAERSLLLLLLLRGAGMVPLL